MALQACLVLDVVKAFVQFLLPTAAHTMEDVEYTLDAFRDIKERLARGEYDKEIPDMALIK